MKFIISDNEHDLDITKADENTLFSKAELFNLSPDELIEIKDKMKSISANIDRIKAQAQYNAENSIATIDGIPTKDRELEEVKELDKAEIIQICTDWAVDEFSLQYKDGEYLPNSCYSIEVVTKEVAESNDKDFNSDLSVDEIKTYKVGEILSYYTKLDDKYYFRFM